ncbi:MAG: CcdB family protein [Ghiorsea sp.]
MAQFDVYANPNPDTNKHIPYLLDVQAELLDILATRVVIPLHTTASIPKPLRHLNPVLDINHEKYVLSTAELAGIPVAMLGQPITNISAQRQDIIEALDFTFTGI